MKLQDRLREWADDMKRHREDPHWTGYVPEWEERQLRQAADAIDERDRLLEVLTETNFMLRNPSPDDVIQAGLFLEQIYSELIRNR